MRATRFMARPSKISSPHRREASTFGDFPVILIRTRPIGTTCPDQRACESLTSWLFRLQKANAVARGAISAAAGLWPSTLIDAPLDPGRALRAWSKVSGRSVAEIAPMLLFFDDRQISGKGHCIVMRDWALPGKGSAGLFYRTRHVVCPACLLEDESPYWRRSWRLCTTVNCEVHHCAMIENCPSCGSTFVAPGRRLLPLTHCGDCGFDIRDSAPQEASSDNNLVTRVLHDIYRRPAWRDQLRHPWPCLATRRFLNLACSAAPTVDSIEALARQRSQAGLENRLDCCFRERFISRAIEVRRRAVCLVEDFALRRPTDFGLLTHLGDEDDMASWLAKFHAICSDDGLGNRSRSFEGLST
ncbi:TniQ family protein [Variovorax atrisoli]|uniref:TniQ family protein n=1 Tax=Variovorax atrisoli TaxID=3394203 RepID=UPI0009B7608A